MIDHRTAMFLNRPAQEHRLVLSVIRRRVNLQAECITDECKTETIDGDSFCDADVINEVGLVFAGWRDADEDGVFTEVKSGTIIKTVLDHHGDIRWYVSENQEDGKHEGTTDSETQIV